MTTQPGMSFVASMMGGGEAAPGMGPLIMPGQVPSNLQPEPYVSTTIPTDPDEVISMVERRFMDMGALHDRMDKDYEAFRLASFKPDAQEGVEDEDAVTGNKPYTLARQVISYITSSELVVQVPNRRADEERRDANQQLEQFLRGLLEMVDDRLAERADPNLISQLAAFSVIRGPLCVRRMLKKDEYGETVPEAFVFDPRWCAFQRDARGIKWFAYKIRKHRDEVSDAYELAIPNSYGDSRGLLTCYDFYAREPDGTFSNCVIADKAGYAKPRTQVFSEKFPIIVVAGGDLPMLQSDSSIDGATVAQWAESVFAANRNLWKVSDRADSYQLALTARAVDQPMKQFSNMGDKLPEENPVKKGGVIPQSRNNNEDIEAIPLTESPRDAQMLAAKLNNMLATGGLPDHILGILEQPLSGVALRQIGQRVNHVIAPFVKRTETALRQLADGWCADFKTGSFAPVRVYGMTHNRQPFEAEVMPEVIQNAARPYIRLIPAVPEDTLENWTIAEIARRPNAQGQPLVSDRFIQDRLLKIDDAEWAANEVAENMAQFGTPFAQAVRMAEAAFKAKKMYLAKYYMQEARKHRMMSELEAIQIEQQYLMMTGQIMPEELPMGGMGAMPQGGPQQPGQGGQQPPQRGGGPAKGMNPRVMPAGRFGQEPDTASPDAGYATRNARPGGQNPQTRALRSVGIEPGR